MPIPMPPTAPIDPDALGAFLISDRAPENSMGLSDLDGPLTGVESRWRIAHEAVERAAERQREAEQERLGLRQGSGMRM